jgi:hypothetical protein
MAEAVKATITEAVNTAFKLNQAKDTGSFDAYWSKYWKDDDCIMIRPSGNPMDKATWKGMIAMEGISVTKSEVTSVDSTRFLADGTVCVATYTCHDIFTYKGTPNDDVAKFSATLEKVGTEWKFVHAHRATGQPPKKA